MTKPGNVLTWMAASVTAGCTLSTYTRGWPGTVSYSGSQSSGMTRRPLHERMIRSFARSGMTRSAQRPS